MVDEKYNKISVVPNTAELVIIHGFLVKAEKKTNTMVAAIDIKRPIPWEMALANSSLFEKRGCVLMLKSNFNIQITTLDFSRIHNQQQIYMLDVNWTLNSEIYFEVYINLENDWLICTYD